MASNFETEARANSDDVNKDNLKKLTSLKAEIDGVLHASSSPDQAYDQAAEKISNEFFNVPKSEIEDVSEGIENPIPSILSPDETAGTKLP